jgi:hypothetical protein
MFPLILHSATIPTFLQSLPGPVTPVFGRLLPRTALQVASNQNPSPCHRFLCLERLYAQRALPPTELRRGPLRAAIRLHHP